MASTVLFSLLLLSLCLFISSSSARDKQRMTFPLLSATFLFASLFLDYVMLFEAVVESVYFTYGGSHGPANWGKLSPTFAECSHGKAQSPIDIVSSEAVHSKSLKPIFRNYLSGNATLVDNGFNVGVRFEEYVGCVVAAGKNCSLKQIHWHSPSEHRIDGRQFAAELHLVHRTDDGSYTVLAVLYHLGGPDPFFSKLQEKFVEMEKEVREGYGDVHIPMGSLDTKYLRRKSRKYFTYVGSLTTPPCYENVTWYILGKVRTMSKEQVEMLKSPLTAAYKNNSRPVQPLNGRHIALYEELARH